MKSSLLIALLALSSLHIVHAGTFFASNFSNSSGSGNLITFLDPTLSTFDLNVSKIESLSRVYLSNEASSDDPGITVVTFKAPVSGNGRYNGTFSILVNGEAPIGTSINDLFQRFCLGEFTVHADTATGRINGPLEFKPSAKNPSLTCQQAVRGEGLIDANNPFQYIRNSTNSTFNASTITSSSGGQRVAAISVAIYSCMLTVLVLMFTS